MHKWLSGGVSPCQGEGRGFESRLVLFSNEAENLKNKAFRYFFVCLKVVPGKAILLLRSMEIGYRVFEECSYLSEILVAKGSYAETWAKEHGQAVVNYIPEE